MKKNKKYVLLFLIIIISSCWSPKGLLYNNFINILVNCDTSDKVAGHMARIKWFVEKKHNRIRYYEKKSSLDEKYFGDYYEFYSGTTDKFYYCFSFDASSKYDKFIKFISANSIKEELDKSRNCVDGELYKMSNECFICDKGFKEKNNGFLIIISKSLNFNMPEIHVPHKPTKIPPIHPTLPGGGTINPQIKLPPVQPPTPKHSPTPKNKSYETEVETIG